MRRKIGLFSDIHGTNTLNALAEAFSKLGVDNALFLGDAVYETMSQTTLHDSGVYSSFAEQIREDSPLRKQLLEGIYSEEQIKNIAKKGLNAKEISNNVAETEYNKLKKMSLELRVLGGNWDYKDKIEETFGEDYINGKLTELNGIKIAGFSGGGAVPGMTFASETLATSDSDERQYYVWQELLSQQEIGADVFASHVPFIPPKGHKEYDSELLFEAVLKRKAAGLDVPQVYMWGHEHSSGKVEFNERLDAFVVSPGTCATNHNGNMAPTFMTTEFNDENKLTKVNKYEIRSSLEGLANVVMVEEFELDYENKKVKSEKKEKTIISEVDIEKTKKHLDLDKSQKLIDEGFCFDYSDLSTKEKDSLLKRNIGVMFDYQQKKQDLVENIVKKVGVKFLDNFDLKDAADEVYGLLVKEASKEFNASLDHVKDESTKSLFEAILIQAAFGANSEDVYGVIRKDGIKDSKDFVSNSKNVSKVCSDGIKKHVQQYVLFKNLEEKDYQEMAEVYMPLNFERKHNLDRDNAFNLWLKTYQQGLLTEKDMEEFKEGYSKIEGYEKKPIEKDKLLSMFGVEEKESIEDKLERQNEMQREMQRQRTQIPDESREDLSRLNLQNQEQEEAIGPVSAEYNS